MCIWVNHKYSKTRSNIEVYAYVGICNKSFLPQLADSKKQLRKLLSTLFGRSAYIYIIRVFVYVYLWSLTTVTKMSFVPKPVQTIVIKKSDPKEIYLWNMKMLQIQLNESVGRLNKSLVSKSSVDQWLWTIKKNVRVDCFCTDMQKILHWIIT